MANDWQFNPVKWDFGSINTWYALGQGAVQGYQMGMSTERYVRKVVNKRYTELLSDLNVAEYNSKFELDKNYTYGESFNESLDEMGSSNQNGWWNDDYLEFTGSRVKGKLRVDGSLNWYTKRATGIYKKSHSWTALSGSRTLKPIPQGDYFLLNYRMRSEIGYNSSDVGFSVDMYAFGLMPLVFPVMIVIMDFQWGSSSSSFWIE